MPWPWKRKKKKKKIHEQLVHLLARHPRRSAAAQVHAHLLTSGAHRRLPAGAALALWKPILRLYSLGPSPEEALLLLLSQKPLLSASGDSFTFSFLIKSCANLRRPAAGRHLHAAALARGFSPGVYLQTALLNMYASCGLLPDAAQVFDEMPHRNTVSFNAMIAALASSGRLPGARALFSTMPAPNIISWTCLIDGYTRGGQPGEALALFKRMPAAGIPPTAVTILAVAPAINGLDLAASVHGVSARRGLLCLRVLNCLIDAYAKAGAAGSAAGVFEEVFNSGRESVVTWTSLVAAHGGLVEEGLGLLGSMARFGVEPGEKHYGCVVDLLGRAGRLEEAERVALAVPGSSLVWRTLLNCCCLQGEAGMGERALKKVVELERELHSLDFVVMSNVLTRAGRLGDAERVRMVVNRRRLPKIPGRSLV
ncbi:pentatricopeptide repeat-containing protein At1g09220, mitochondrial-like [Wolffia australiana]